MTPRYIRWSRIHPAVGRGGGVTFGPHACNRQWAFALLYGGGYVHLGPVWWQGLCSWYLGWRRTSYGLMVDIGPFSIRVREER